MSVILVVSWKPGLQNTLLLQYVLKRQAMLFKFMVLMVVAMNIQSKGTFEMPRLWKSLREVPKYNKSLLLTMVIKNIDYKTTAPTKTKWKRCEAMISKQD